MSVYVTAETCLPRGTILASAEGDVGMSIIGGGRLLKIAKECNGIEIIECGDMLDCVSPITRR